MKKQEKTIIVLANKYPNFMEPNVNVFTQQVVWSLVDQGCTCIVICPIALNYHKLNYKFPQRRIEKTESGKEVMIYHPKYIGMGQNGKIALKTRVMFTTKGYVFAVDQVLKKMNLEHSVILAEFLCPSGVAASLLGLKYKVPAYMQCGEATYQGDLRYGNRKLCTRLLTGLTGVIALSEYNRDYLLNAGVIDKNKIIILPSGYKKERIYPRDKKKSRVKLGLPLDKFIVGFCGSYDERKGILRLQKAIDMIESSDICLAAVGKGACEPTSDRCIFKGTLNHAELAWFYSAIDVFAFPTYYEGCCTAIVEAIACGCPIISSNRPFNYGICDNTNSILIEPDDIVAMKENILKLSRDDTYRTKLSQGSLMKAKELSLDKKAEQLIKFMNL